MLILTNAQEGALPLHYVLTKADLYEQVTYAFHTKHCYVCKACRAA